ncbi:IclR family transcriptional regulator [Advenella kashmirensis W13003]|uniref:IclR family transcriptional regulator n=1 Tax=Advenella kashmirensis W13003 TaxID=1424334 RepID=V8QXW7_9BURK|nr:IclR family transcriptional regulator [Advenella kashmirensis]ETF04203.1 IclR family transcriptional regulator [Advenella kashmirensis W13003]
MTNTDSKHLRILTVIEHLACASYPLSLAQIAQRTQLPKASVLRLLQQLQDAAYVTRLPEDRGYVLGARSHQTALSVLSSTHFDRMCRLLLGKLVAAVGETCNLTALIDSQVHYLARVEPQSDMRLQLHLRTGAHVPLHCTASGKLFLAMLPEVHRSRLLEQLPLPAMTPKTITDRTRLAHELALIAQQKIGTDNEEFVKGMVAIAVPVQDDRGRVIAAVACHAPTATHSFSDLFGFSNLMKETAVALGHVLAGSARTGAMQAPDAMSDPPGSIHDSVAPGN